MLACVDLVQLGRRTDLRVMERGRRNREFTRLLTAEIPFATTSEPYQCLAISGERLLPSWTIRKNDQPQTLFRLRLVGKEEQGKAEQGRAGHVYWDVASQQSCSPGMRLLSVFRYSRFASAPLMCSTARGAMWLK